MTQLEGGCLCGAIRVRSTGKIEAKALCHCLDCRKITGSVFSTNLLVASDGFTFTRGTPKAFSKKADSGKVIKSSFCEDCGTTLCRESETYAGLVIIKAGTLDSQGALEEEAKPAAELFVANRIPWLPGFEGTAQSEGA